MIEKTDELIDEIHAGVLSWYDFTSGASVLYIGKRDDSLGRMLSQRAVDLSCVELSQVNNPAWQEEQAAGFDYLVSIADLEKESNPAHVVTNWKKLLKKNGKLLLGMNNRLGIRYFCGDRDPYTQRNFDGIENYRRAYAKTEDYFRGRMYSQAELRDLLQSAGSMKCRFFSVLPDLRHAALIYSEEYLPKEDILGRVFPKYNSPDTVFLEENGLYQTLVKDGLFHKLANAYFIECSLSNHLSDVQHVTCSMERGRQNALLTIIHKSGVVEKRAIFPDGEARLKELWENGRDLAAHGISVVHGALQDGAYRMPYVEAEVGQVYLQQLLYEDKNRFLSEMDHFRDLIFQSADIVENRRDEGPILRNGYLDMVPLNTFYQNEEFVFFDQEFCISNYPANAILWRAIETLYGGAVKMQQILPIEQLWNRYGLLAQRELWEKLRWEFISKLRKIDELASYYATCQITPEVVNSNRQRLNFSAEAYQRLFIDIFGGLGNRKVILFGSGRFAQRFLTLYGEDYPVSAVLDNQKARWGTMLGNVTIQSPEMLSGLLVGTYRVIICIKNYLSVVQQLKQMGIQDYAIFDPNRDYPRKHKPVLAQNNQAAEPAVAKKYHVGYIAGVFDLFHVGHLNMFKRAREQCDYLIVGVVSDEGVRKFKKTEPFIPFEERIEMVRSCRYVDEARKIPLDYAGTRDAWRMYHFDVQFSGSDYVANPDWLAEKEFLQKRGADLVFFPYTEQTSSTKIKALIQEKLV